MKARIIIITLMLVAIFGTVAFATTGKITNAPSGLILRKEASKSGAVITTLSNGTEIEIIEKTGDWYKVKYKEQDGYLFAEFVKPNEEVAPAVEQGIEETPAGDVNVQNIKSDINVYIMPNISSTVINVLPKDTAVTVLETAGKWSYISANNITGWVRTYKINNETKVEEVPAEKPVEETKPAEVAEVKEPVKEAKTETTPTTLKRGYINVDSVNVRQEPNTTAKVVTTLIKGTGVEITGESGEWYKINFQDKISGYIRKDLISGNQN